MLLRLLAAILILAGCAPVAAGRIVLSGTVTDSIDGGAVPGASVKLLDAKGKIKRFTSTSKEGTFVLKTVPADAVTLEVSMIGYAKKSMPVDTAVSKVEIILSPKTTTLKEVAVTAARIRENGDTVTYDVASFSQKQDRNIGDVLNRMPGVEVDKSGRIQYQGTDINKFYIEGNDLLGGKYGLATKNIDHTDVGSVEVLENHQPMQVLRGLSFSDQAAINLKMKSRAKATLVAHGNFGGGYSMQPEGALWKGDLFAMMLSGRYQMLTTAGADNTGSSLNAQLMNFSAVGSGDDLQGYLSLATPSVPGLKRSRTLMNRSWLFSSSHLWKNKWGGEFKAQIDYVNDRTTALSSATTTYFLESGDRVISERKNSLEHYNALTGMFSYEVNEKTYFLNNTLSFNLGWNDLTLATSGSLTNTQEARTPSHDVTNSLKIIKRYGGKHLVTFSSINRWESMPERLSVDNSGDIYGQRIGQRAFFTDERASYGFVVKRFLVSLEAGLGGYFRRLTTGLFGVSDTDMPGLAGDGALTTDYFRVFASPKLEWNHRRIELTLKVPLNFYTYFFSAGLKNRTELFASPSLSMRWKITPRMDLTLNGSARRSPASLHNIHEYLTLSDYRTFQAGVDDYYSTSGQSVSLNYQYRYPAKGWFVNMRALHSWNKSKYGSAQTIAGDYIIYSYHAQPSRSQSTNVYVAANKSLDFMGGTVGVSGSYATSHNNVLSQGESVDYRSRTLTLSPGISGRISDYVNWSYRFNFARMSLAMTDMPTRHTDNYSHYFSLTATPVDKLRFTASGEYYRNAIEAHRYKNMVMVDANLTYSINRKIDLTASVTNILNHRTYSYSTYGTLSVMERSSSLRGREFLITIYIKK